MPRRKSTPSSELAGPIPALPLDEQSWLRIAGLLRLSPMHTQIVELLLRGMCRKQIAAILTISDSTLATHMGRIFRRLEVADHVEVILRVFAEFHKMNSAERVPSA